MGNVSLCYRPVLDVEGTLTPEAWLALQKKTNLEELLLTTAHEPDYDKLMRYRIDVLNQHNIKIEDMRDVVRDLEPLPGRRGHVVVVVTGNSLDCLVG